MPPIRGLVFMIIFYIILVLVLFLFRFADLSFYQNGIELFIVSIIGFVSLISLLYKKNIFPKNVVIFTGMFFFFYY